MSWSGPYTGKHRKIPFSSGVSGRTHVFTLSKKSVIFVEWIIGGINNINVAVDNGQSTTTVNNLTFAKQDTRRGSGLFAQTYRQAESFGSIASSGTPIHVTRSRCNIIIHIWEIE